MSQGVKLSLFSDGITLYLINPGDYQKTLEFDKDFQQISRIQNQHEISNAFLYTTNKVVEKELWKTVQCTTLKYTLK